jgi:hypothetical protein
MPKGTQRDMISLTICEEYESNSVTERDDLSWGMKLQQVKLASNGIVSAIKISLLV